jgi:alkylated DNA repair dioxygenase AlkB
MRAPLHLPEGFSYQAGLIAPAEEIRLVEGFADLPFKEFEFRGYLGKRRVVFYGWRYDFNNYRLARAEAIPEFLLPLRESAARFAGLEPQALEQVLVTEYAPGAGIGWHKDRQVFGDVVGVSLLSPCVFRFRRKAGDKWQRASFVAEPRSVYALKGPARDEWEHSIPAVDSLRYSVTFRTMRAAPS